MNISESIEVRNASLATIKQIIKNQRRIGTSDTEIIEMVMKYIDKVEAGK